MKGRQFQFNLKTKQKNTKKKKTHWKESQSTTLRKNTAPSKAALNTLNCSQYDHRGVEKRTC